MHQPCKPQLSYMLTLSKQKHNSGSAKYVVPNTVMFVCVYINPANITQFRYAEMLPIAHLRQCDPQTTAEEMFTNLSLPITQEMLLMIYILRSYHIQCLWVTTPPK